MSTTRKLLEVIAKEMGKETKDIEPYIKILENEWYDKVDSLSNISDAEWMKLNIPLRLVNLIKMKLAPLSPMPTMEEIKEPIPAPITKATKQENSFLTSLDTSLHQLKEEIQDIYTFKICVKTLHIYLANILRYPTQLKKRTINLANEAFKKRVGNYKSALKFLQLCGFKEELNEFILADKDLKLERVEVGQELLFNLGRSFAGPEKVEEEHKFDGTKEGIVSTTLSMVDSVYSKENDHLALKTKIEEERIKRQEAAKQVVHDRETIVYLKTPGPSLNEALSIVNQHETIMTKFELEQDEKRDEKISTLKLLKELDESKSFKNRSKVDLKHAMARPIISKIFIRIKFPDETILQGAFGPSEAVLALYEYVAQFLQIQGRKFNLFIAPPKKVLKANKQTFQSLKLGSNSNCIFEWADLPTTKATDGPFLSDQIIAKYSIIN